MPERLAAVTARGVDAVMLVGPDALIQWANAATTDVLGYEAADLVGVHARARARRNGPLQDADVPRGSGVHLLHHAPVGHLLRGPVLQWLGTPYDQRLYHVVN